MYTLARDAVFEAKERRVNEQGLARLRVGDDGWISEDLNPLSGQRGPIAAPLPVPRPLAYLRRRLTLTSRCTRRWKMSREISGSRLPEIFEER